MGESMSHSGNTSGLFLLLLVISCIAFPSKIAASVAPEFEQAEDGGHEDTPFTYVDGTENGPSRWGFLNPEWAVCSLGKSQSPIDLYPEKALISPHLGQQKLDYKPAPAVIVSRGHDIMVKWNGDAGHIVIDGTRFNLLQCHWHSPSEHYLRGTRYDLELHVVHQSADGHIAVIGILYEYGGPDPFLEKLYQYIKNVNKEETHLGVVDPRDIGFGLGKYFRYKGSLTTPPCTEGVTWTVIEKVRTASLEQVDALRDAVDAGFEDNARPIQPGNGRPLYLYPNY